jgi:hypothetical protein
MLGWPATEALQNVWVTIVPDFVLVKQIGAHKALFGHILKAERGRHKQFPLVADGYFISIYRSFRRINPPCFLTIREKERTLLY